MRREEIIHTFKAQKIAEVGVLRGRFAKHLLSTDPKELHLIDPWKSYKKEVLPEYHKKNQADWDKTYEAVRRKFAGDSRVMIHRLTSEEAAKRFPDSYFDFVYIDANHAYEFIKQDIELWLPKVKKGGILGGHDYNGESIAKAVNEKFPAGVTETDEMIKKSPAGMRFPSSWFITKN